MFYDATLFDFTQEFENNWRAIREEYFNLDDKILDFHRDTNYKLCQINNLPLNK